MNHHFAPFEQFKIKEIFSYKIYDAIYFSLTNYSLALLTALTFIIGSFLLSYSLREKFFFRKIYALWELCFIFMRKTTANSFGEDIDSLKIKKYSRFIFSLFTFILILNLFGLVPFSYAITSNIISTFTMAAIIFIICVAVSIKKHGIYFYRIFIPAGTPWWIAPLVFILEFFAYLARPLSLSIRLAANILAGHVILEVIAFFCVIMGIFFIVPYIFLVCLMGFEIMVAALQAYIFTILASIYLAEAEHH